MGKVLMIDLLEQEKIRLEHKLRLVEQALNIYKAPGIESFANRAEWEQTSLLRSAEMNIVAQLIRYNSYDANTPIGQKVLMVIKTERRFLHAREIARIVCMIEGKESLENYIRKVSPALSMMKKDGSLELVSIKVGHNYFNTFWGYKHWLSKNGEIKKPFLYRTDELRVFRQKLSKNPF